MLALDGFGRWSDAIDAALEFFEQPPIVGLHRKLAGELAWTFARRAGRLPEVGKVFAAFSAWQFDLEPVRPVVKFEPHASSP